MNDFDCGGTGVTDFQGFPPRIDGTLSVDAANIRDWRKMPRCAVLRCGYDGSGRAPRLLIPAMRCDIYFQHLNVDIPKAQTTLFRAKLGLVRTGRKALAAMR